MIRSNFSICLNVVCLLLSASSLADAARILAIFPYPAKSRFSFNEAIVKSLHSAGHNVTIISPFASENQSPNYTMIDSRSTNTTIYIGMALTGSFSNLSLATTFHLAAQVDEKLCSDVIQLKAVQDALDSADKQYDVMFTDCFLMYSCYYPVAQKLGIPIIGTIALRTWTLWDSDVGFPNNLATITNEFSGFKTQMTFVQRLENIWLRLITNYFAFYVIPSKANQFYQKYFPDFELRNKKFSMLFYNNHASVLPRPSTPNTVEVAGIHIQPATPLPQNLQKFIDEAENGVILFTLGSVVNASSMSLAERTAFVNAFAVIPQRVIWKYEQAIEGISDNVLLSSWVPQRDILDHKNVKAFITHCGLSGTYEAIHTGTPVIATPLFLDQPSNSALLEELGVGVRLDYWSVTSDKVLEALNTIINDTRYYDKMQNLSRVFKDRPMTPQESVVYWTEYVIRHNGAPHLQAVGSEMPWYQFFLIDILLAVTGVATVLSCVTMYFIKKCCRIMRKSRIPIKKEKIN